MAERRRRWRARAIIAPDLEVLPLMNLFIVLIPLLLLSAVFIEVAVIDMAMPSAAEAEAAKPEEALNLTVRIEEDAWIVEAHRVPARRILRAPVGSEEAVVADANLSAALEEIVAAHPDNRQVRIVSRPATHYEEIIAVMDIARAAGLSQAGLMGAGESAP